MEGSALRRVSLDRSPLWRSRSGTVVWRVRAAAPSTLVTSQKSRALRGGFTNRVRNVNSPDGVDWIAVTESPLSAPDLTTWATRPECGAVVAFSGTARNHSTSEHVIEALEYDTSVELAEMRLTHVVEAARRRWPDLGAIAIHHRVGMVRLEEPAVVIVVSAPHRQSAFEASRFCIDTVKRSVPMWKREIWEGGSAWSEEASPIEGVGDR